MNAQELAELGFSVVGGQVDYKNVNYGQLLPTGALLTPEGEALAISLRKAAQDPLLDLDNLVGQPVPPRRGRPPKEQ